MTGSIGVSVASAALSCSPQCSGNRLSGPLFLLRGGAQLSPQLTLVLEADQYRQTLRTEKGDGEWRMSWYMLGAVWYPNAEEDFFVNVGIGVSMLRNHVSFPSVTAGPLGLNSSDLGASVGIGRDFRLSDRAGVTAYLGMLFSPKSQALVGRANSGARMAADIVHAGLAATFF